jgi:protocatechuate 3,4-dioxygenase beta subunit
MLGLAAAGAGLLPHRTPAAEQAKGPAPAPAEKPTPPAAPPVPLPPGEAKEMTVTGRVLGPDGKPVARADVAVVTFAGLFFSEMEDYVWYRHAVAGRTRADDDGKFRLTFARPPALPERQLRLVAGGGGLGLAWQSLDPAAESAEADFRLPAEQVVRGRVVDLQGEPVAGARVVLTRLTHHPAKGEEDQGTCESPPDGLPFGPVNATADARGDFTFRGLGPNLTAEFEVRDDRVEPHTFTVETSDKKQAANVKLALPPGRIVEGRVTYADTGKAVAGARVLIQTFFGGDVEGQADKDGRYRLNVRPPGKESPESGDQLSVNVYPPAGRPYWMKLEEVKWVKGAARHETNVALPRGVLIRGTITEAGTNRPVAGAYVEYDGGWMHKAVSGADGSYAYAVPAGATGPLTVITPSPDYVPQVAASAEVLEGKKGGDRLYYHAVVPLDLKPGDKEKELPVVLRRGVTMRGRVVGPDGKPVKDAILFAGEYKPPREKVFRPIRVSDGRFELPGCDPDKTYHLVFVEHAWLPSGEALAEAPNTYGHPCLRGLLGPPVKHGAVVDVAAKKAVAEPVEVRLAACGSAKVRFVDGDGKPLAKLQTWLQLVVTDGPPTDQAIREGKLSAEVVTLLGPYPNEAEPHADADGVLTLEGLIPGATYRVKQPDPLGLSGGKVLKEFKVESGKALELTVTVK